VRGSGLARCRQVDIDGWLATGPAACHACDFLAWAARQGHCHVFDVPRPARHTGPAIGPEQRWDQAARLLHDDSLEATNRVAGCLVLLSGQNMSRIAALTTSQVTRHSDYVFIRFGRHGPRFRHRLAPCCSH